MFTPNGEFLYDDFAIGMGRWNSKQVCFTFNQDHTAVRSLISNCIIASMTLERKCRALHNAIKDDLLKEGSYE
jgi:hypothetical protein